ncbi:hypothetical protein EV175_004598, partial [Coemansia sp. RSA 1933]
MSQPVSLVASIGDDSGPAVNVQVESEDDGQPEKTFNRVTRTQSGFHFPFAGQPDIVRAEQKD